MNNFHKTATIAFLSTFWVISAVFVSRQITDFRKKFEECYNNEVIILKKSILHLSCNNKYIYPFVMAFCLFLFISIGHVLLTISAIVWALLKIIYTLLLALVECIIPININIMTLFEPPVENSEVIEV